jgi:hypothetical protein
MEGHLGSQYDWVGHLAYVLVFASFMLRDIIWLRVVAIAACITSVVFNYVAPADPLWVSIQWNIALISVNLFQIAAFLNERKAVALTDKERWLYESLFSNFTTGDYKRLLKLASWHTAQAGELLTTQGQELRDIYLVFTGKGDVVLNGERVASIERGDFVGEMSYLTGETASATIRLSSDCEYLTWSKEEVERLVRKKPTLMAALQNAMARHLSKKIARHNHEVASTSS